MIASDKKRLVVDAFARYRITDPLMFFQSVRDERIANSRLGAILEASLRRVLGSASFARFSTQKTTSSFQCVSCCAPVAGREPSVSATVVSPRCSRC